MCLLKSIFLLLRRREGGPRGFSTLSSCPIPVVATRSGETPVYAGALDPLSCQPSGIVFSS